MKLFVAMSLLFCSALAHANPAVGDDAKYELLIQQSLTDPGVKGILELKITAKDADDNFLVERTQTMNGATNVTKIVLKATDFITDQEIESALTHCESSGGRTGTYTVGTTTVQTCTVFNSSHYSLATEVGKVPFGFVTDSSRDQNHVFTSLTMLSFVKGQ